MINQFGQPNCEKWKGGLIMTNNYNENFAIASVNNINSITKFDVKAKAESIIKAAKKAGISPLNLLSLRLSI